MAVCPKCGSTVSESSKFCKICGQPLDVAKAAPSAAPEATCPHCGNPVSSTAVFCKTCGRSLQASGGTAPATSASAAAAPPEATCPHCGNPVSPTAVFCKTCGRSLQASGGTVPAATATPATAPVATAGAAPKLAPSATPNAAPTFTPPATLGMTPGAAPAIAPPAAPGMAPTFTPPAAPGMAPTFTPPVVSQAQNTMPGSVPAAMPNKAPTFNPPAAPTFNPPAAPTFNAPMAPTFAPPVGSYNGLSCHYHPNDPCVTHCAKCGKPICQDCYDVYGVTAGEYAGQALCYDCTRELVAENVRLLSRQKAKIIALLVATTIGMLLGFAVGITTKNAFWTFMITCWFGSFWFWIKNTIWAWWHAPGGPSLGGFIGAGIGGFIVAPIRTIRKVIECIIYLRRTTADLRGDQQGLQEMADYMEYTLIRNQNPGVDINTLLQQNSQLATNSIAQMARTQSEEQIEAHVRSGVTRINEHGEIIRSFVV